MEHDTLPNEVLVVGCLRTKRGQKLPHTVCLAKGWVRRRDEGAVSDRDDRMFARETKG